MESVDIVNVPSSASADEEDPKPAGLENPSIMNAGVPTEVTLEEKTENLEVEVTASKEKNPQIESRPLSQLPAPLPPPASAGGVAPPQANWTLTAPPSATHPRMFLPPSLLGPAPISAVGPPPSAGRPPPPMAPRPPPPIPAHIPYPVMDPLGPPPPLWTAHDGGNGRYYYYNHQTQESTWLKPESHPYLPGPFVSLPPPGPPLPMPYPSPPPYVPIPRPTYASAFVPESAPGISSTPEPQVAKAKDIIKSAAESFAKEKTVAEPKPSVDAEKPTLLAKNKPTPPTTLAVSALAAAQPFPPGLPSGTPAMPLPPPSASSAKPRTGRGGPPAFKLLPGQQGFHPGIPGFLNDNQAEKKNQAEAEHLEKVRGFRTMLKEKGVTPFSTWEKILPKLVFDPRFIALENKDERRAIFNNFVKTRAQEERRERRDAVKSAQTALQEFLDLPMSQELLTPDITIETFTQALSKKHKKVVKELLKLLPPKETNAIFEEKLKPIREALRLEEETKQEMVRENFLDLLSETKDITKKSYWSSRVRELLEADKRYRRCPMELRQELFEKYVRGLQADGEDVRQAAKRRREEVEKERIRKEEARLKEEELQRRTQEEEDQRVIQKKKVRCLREYKEMLKERVDDPRMGWHEFEWEILREEDGREVLSVLGDQATDLFEAHLKALKTRLEEDFCACLRRVLHGEGEEPTSGPEEEEEEEEEEGQEKSVWARVRKRGPRSPELSLLWVEAKEALKADESYKRCRGRIDCEKLYRRHMADLLNKAKNELDEYLKAEATNKGISRFTSTTGESWQKALDSLANVPAFDKLKNFEQERNAVVTNYIVDLQDQHLKSKRRKF